MDQYAQAYGLDIDWVYANTRFDTLTALYIKWRKFDRYHRKVNELERVTQTK